MDPCGLRSDWGTMAISLLGSGARGARGILHTNCTPPIPPCAAQHRSGIGVNIASLSFPVCRCLTVSKPTWLARHECILFPLQKTLRWFLCVRGQEDISMSSRFADVRMHGSRNRDQAVILRVRVCAAWIGESILSSLCIQVCRETNPTLGCKDIK